MRSRIIRQVPAEYSKRSLNNSAQMRGW